MAFVPRSYIENIGLTCSSAAVMVVLLVSGNVAAESRKIGDPPEATNMRLVGFNELQGRSAYQPTIHHQGNRWIAYIGHHGEEHKSELQTLRHLVCRLLLEKSIL